MVKTQHSVPPGRAYRPGVRLDRPRRPDDVSPARAAKIFRVPAPTVYRWIREGRLPAYRIGARQLRISRADIERMPRPAGVLPHTYRGLERLVGREARLYGAAAANYRRAHGAADSGS